MNNAITTPNKAVATPSLSGSHSHPTHCPNCATELAGKHCHHCGEKVLDHHDLSVKHFFMHHVAHELTHLDGKIFRTLQLLLFKPGFLSAEYFAGRRTRYINPLRLFLTICLLFAFVAIAQRDYRQPLREAIRTTDPTGVTSRLLEAKAQTLDIESQPFREKFYQRSDAFGTALSLTAALFVALALLAIFRRARPYYVQHLVLALHAVSAIALMFLPVIIISALYDKTGGFSLGLSSDMQAQLGLVLFTILPLGLEVIYLFLAFRTFYHSSITRALIAVPVILEVMFLLQTLFTAIGFLLAVVTI